MVAILCAVLASCAYSQSVDSEDGAAARTLYLEASEAINQGDLSAAIERLEALTEPPAETAPADAAPPTHPFAESPLAQVAAFHLAECYLLTGRPHDALTLLTFWSPKIAESSAAESLQPGILDQLRELAIQSSTALTLDDPSLVILQRYLEQTCRDDDAAATEHRTLLIRELARRQVALGHYAEAIEGLRVLGEAANDQINYQIPLRWAHHELELGNAPEAIRILTGCSEVARLEPPQAAALALQLSEAYILDGQPQRALEQLTQLSEAASAQAAASAPWAGSVALRRSELLVQLRRLPEAVSALRAAKQHHPQFEQVHEFDYLLARCAIADADFETARQHLQLAAQAPTATGREAAARATWMIGETFFLQRDYQHALSVYQQVISLDGARQWRAHGRLQAAKCQELLGHPTEALAAYEKIESECSLHDAGAAAIVSEASQRIAILRSRLAPSSNPPR